MRNKIYAGSSLQWNPSTKATLGAMPKCHYRGVDLVRKVVMQVDNTGLSRVVFVDGFYYTDDAAEATTTITVITLLHLLYFSARVSVRQMSP